ncbi:MAG TPA: signal recognition particle-docking protein FtsY [Nitrosopumilaceae archaeon]|nr:signal recognition particle-docking protein FtsY [Nitrosopumilaceae archaeon]
MFEKLRNAFSSAAKSFGQKELKEKDIDKVLFELEVALLESDVATEVIDSLKSDLKQKLIGATVEKEQIANIVKQNLREHISNMFDSAGKVDIISNIEKKKSTGEPYIISFMGINGTGKTTTVAKVAYLLRENKFSVVIAAADTYRAGAIEQITEHAKRLNLKIIAQNYGSDPAAVSRDAVLYAKSHKIDCILIDTAGRMQTSKNLMDQISKINKVVNPDFKIFVGDSLAGNDTVNQAREFHQYTKFEGSILTKSDADARGGAAISIVKVTSTPILYLGVGQEYKDLKPFDKDSFLESLFGAEEISVPQPEIRMPQTPIPIQQENTEKPEIIKVKQEIVPKPELKPELKLEQVKPIQAEKIEEKIEYHVKSNEISKSIEKEQPKPAPKPETKSKPEIKQEKIHVKDEDDPFAGIATKDIEKYSVLYNVPPPENNKDAKNLAEKIKNWISQGRPKPDESAKEQVIEEEIEEDTVEQEDVKPKKKRSLFGWGKK